MKHKKKKGQKMHVGEEDYLLANRRASREIEIERHGKPVSLRPAIHTPKTAYSRSRMKRQAVTEACLLCFHSAPSSRKVRIGGGVPN